MYPVSQQFKGAIYAQSRRLVGRVTFDISDVTASGDITSISTTVEAGISRKEQLSNKVRDQTYNLATLETNRFKLDGSFSFADDVITNNGETGFVSGNLCGVNGVFESYPTITFIFGSTHSSVGLTITFDKLNKEYATDFNVSVYGAANELIASVDVAGNKDLMSTPMGQLFEYKMVVITIKKWSVGDRRARVLEVDFGVVKIYTDDNLISMGLVEDLDLTSSNLSSAEFSFAVDNSGREFNILNPTGFYKYLQQRQQVIAELGLDLGEGEVEFVPLGEFFLWEWTSEEGALTASFKARTSIDFMASFEYENLTAKVGYSLYQLAVDMFIRCGVTNYFIDPALQSISTKALVKNTNCKNVLQMIALAGCANIFVNRNGRVNIVILPGLTGPAVDGLTLDNMYNVPQIRLDTLVKQVNVTYFSGQDIAGVASSVAPVDSGDTLKLDNNTLIDSPLRAQAVAGWILAQQGKRAIFNANWRGNPAHELGDIISIENDYGASVIAYVTKNELEYQGYLAGKTEARGGVN